MTINFTKIIIAAVATLSLGLSLAQTQAPIKQSSFDGHYQRRKVADLFGTNWVTLEDADLFISGSTGTFKYFPSIQAEKECYGKEVPIEMVEGNDAAIKIRMKFPCKEQTLNFHHIVRGGKPGLARDSSEVFEFEKVEQPQPLKLSVSNAPKTTFDGRYERRDYSIMRDDKPYPFFDADMTISRDSGTFRYINSVGLCTTREVPVEVLKIENNMIQILVKRSVISPSCSDNQIYLHFASEDGVMGLVYDGDTKVAFKKIKN